MAHDEVAGEVPAPSTPSTSAQQTGDLSCDADEGPESTPVQGAGAGAAAPKRKRGRPRKRSGHHSPSARSDWQTAEGDASPSFSRKRTSMGREDEGCDDDDDDDALDSQGLAVDLKDAAAMSMSPAQIEVAVANIREASEKLLAAAEAGAGAFGSRRFPGSNRVVPSQETGDRTILAERGRDASREANDATDRGDVAGEDGERGRADRRADEDDDGGGCSEDSGGDADGADDPDPHRTKRLRRHDLVTHNVEDLLCSDWILWPGHVSMRREKDPDVRAARKKTRDAVEARKEAIAEIAAAREAMEEATGRLRRALEAEERSVENLRASTDELVETELRRRADDPWNKLYRDLEKFREEHGHAYVSFHRDFRTSPELRRLDAFAQEGKKQYREHREGIRQCSRPYRLVALQRVGVFQGRWQARYLQLKDFKKKHGHCNVPGTGYATNPYLGNWVKMNRAQYRKRKAGKENRLSEERIRLLNEIGFCWNVKGQVRMKANAESTTENCQDGDAIGEGTNEESREGRGAERGNIDNEGADKEDGSEATATREKDLGRSWPEQTWPERYLQLKDFRDKYGHCDVPNRYTANPRLGSWVRTIRHGYMSRKRKKKKSPLLETKIQLLNEIGFRWSTKNAQKKKNRGGTTRQPGLSSTERPNAEGTIEKGHNVGATGEGAVEEGGAVRGMERTAVGNGSAEVTAVVTPHEFTTPSNLAKPPLAESLRGGSTVVDTGGARGGYTCGSDKKRKRKHNTDKEYQERVARAAKTAIAASVASNKAQKQNGSIDSSEKRQQSTKELGQRGSSSIGGDGTGGSASSTRTSVDRDRTGSVGSNEAPQQSSSSECSGAPHQRPAPSRSNDRYSTSSLPHRIRFDKNHFNENPPSNNGRSQSKTVPEDSNCQQKQTGQTHPRNKFGSNENNNFQFSHESVQEEQERLFSAAAARARMQVERQRQMECARGGAQIFIRPVEDLTKLHENHWKWSNPYSRLGLPQLSSQAVVKAQYKRLALLYHPDKCRRDDAPERFQAVKEAYERLSKDANVLSHQ